MYGQNITPRLRKEARKKSPVIANGSPSRCLPAPATIPARASAPHHREYERPGPRVQIASGQDSVVKRDRESQEQDRKHAGGKPPDATVGPGTQFALALEHEPAGAKQRVAEHEPSQDRKRVQPAERSASVLTVHHWNAAH